MYKCIKCNKEFKYESEFNRHINRKTNCNINNINLECIICKVKLTRAYDKLRHEKTKKHIYNINKNNNKDIEINNETNILNEKINNLENDNNLLKNDNNLLKNDNNLLKKEIIKLKNENKSLIESNQLLRNNQKIHIAKEYIYIIHCAQHINENIYKIGRTKNIINRFKQYPNGSELLFTITCNNSKLIENNNKDIEINNETNILNEKINNLENDNNLLKNDNNLLKNDNNLLKKEIIKLKNENKSLIESNQLLRNNQKIHIAKEYIYIIHCAQHINENIYKIGRTKNIINRFKQYPNGSELLFTITCNNSKLIENNIIQYLKNNINYIHYKESGNEYFKCNLENLKIDIQNIINTNL